MIVSKLFIKYSHLGIYTIFPENMNIKNLTYNDINNDIKLYFSTDLNFLRESRILPFLDSYLKIKDNDIIRYNFYLVIKKIVQLDIDEVFIHILKLNYNKFNKRWQKIISFGFTHLLKFYGISLEIADCYIDNQINLKKFIKNKYGKKSVLDFNILSNGIYKILRKKYLILNRKSYYFNKLLLEEINYIKLNTNRNIENDLDLIKFISVKGVKGVKGVNILFNMEKYKVGGAEKQFHILYNTVSSYFKNVECATELIYAEEKLFDFEKYKKAYLNAQHKKNIRLIKNTTLKRYVFNAAVNQLFYNPSYIISSMHYCGLGNLVANSIMGRHSYNYIRIGSQPPLKPVSINGGINKYNLIKNIYELYKGEMSIIVNCDYLRKSYQNILPYNRIIKIYNVVDKPDIASSIDTQTNTMRLGFVGRNTPSKNILDLILLFSKLESEIDIPVRMYIYSDKLINTPVQELVNNLNLNTKIHLLENEEDPTTI